MKKYQIDEKLINELIDLMESYRNDLGRAEWDSAYIGQKRWKARELRRRLRKLKRVKWFCIKWG